jgi:hypothetical protein
MDREVSDDIKWRYYVVAYLDVLGQKEAFHSVDFIPSSESEKAKLIEALKNTFHFLEVFRNGFKTYFDQLTKPTETSEKVPEDKKALFEEMRKSDIHFSQFSDFVIAWAPLQTDSHPCAQINSIWGILTAASSMFILSLFARHAVRGGIEIGTGLEMATGEPYGPALNKAYSLESRVADDPRIVIGGQLIDYFHSHKNMAGNDVFTNYAREHADRCLKMVRRDIDGFPILDWMGKDIEGLFKTIEPPNQKASTAQILQGVDQFINNERERFVRRQDAKLVERYTKLTNYFRSRVTDWEAWKIGDES